MALTLLVRQIHLINQDGRGSQLLELLMVERSVSRTSPRHQMVYRHACEEVIGADEHLFRFEWLASQESLIIQLMSSDETTMPTAKLDQAGAWSYYLDSYALDQPTEGLRTETSGPLLVRNRPALDTTGDSSAVKQQPSDLAVRLGFDSYKLSYVCGTEETVAGTQSNSKTIDLAELRRKRKDAWQRWLISGQAGNDSGSFSANNTSIAVALNSAALMAGADATLQETDLSSAVAQQQAMKEKAEADAAAAAVAPAEDDMDTT